ncbi:MAG: C39 family peptidase [Coleofasciculaceae cyanobacterium]
MKLQNFLGTTKKYDWKQIAADQELTRQIQQRLIDLNLLGPPIDGKFGPVSTAALQRFQKLMQCQETGFLGAETAEKLIETKQQDIVFPPPVLKVIQDTFFKARPLQSSTLSEPEKQKIEAGTVLELVAFEFVRDHLRITLRKDSFKNSKIWYVYKPDIQILREGIVIYPKPKPQSLKLPNFPYKSQLDNFYNPTGACNVTSMAMCLQFLGKSRRDNIGQFEDELYEYTLNKGLSRWSPYDLAKLVEDYGAKDLFKNNAVIEEVQDWLADGKPVVIHGYFTTFGHIMPVVGYDQTGLYVNDPYGEWFPSGYDKSASGAYLHYSYDLIRRVCMADGDFWVHFISK